MTGRTTVGARLRRPQTTVPPAEVAPVRAIVTGAAGFIGSHLSEALVDAGWSVVGIDAFTSAYPRASKRRNLGGLVGRPGFELLEADVAQAALQDVLAGADVVFHLAAIPGVRASWSDRFRSYLHANVLGTQRLLEAARHTGIGRFVYASSSSVYGNADRYPVPEDASTRPQSPYGVTKLAAEQLCDRYRDVFGLPTVSLRFFSVYGPRQRPDMGIHRVIEAGLGRAEFTLFGDGTQVRDVTYVGDVVQAAIMAALAEAIPASAVNIAGGSAFSMNELIGLVGELIGRDVPVARGPEQLGDVRRTAGAIDLARTALDWKPQVDLRAGLERQIGWHRTALHP